MMEVGVGIVKVEEVVKEEARADQWLLEVGC